MKSCNEGTDGPEPFDLRPNGVDPCRPACDVFARRPTEDPNPTGRSSVSPSERQETHMRGAIRAGDFEGLRRPGTAPAPITGGAHITPVQDGVLEGP